MFAYAGSQPLLPKIAHNQPEFERTEAATERSAIIHQIGYRLTGTLRVAQVLRDEAERRFHYFRFACIKNATIDWSKEPLVGIDNQAVRPFAPRQRPAHYRVNSSRAAICSIDMQPQAIPFADISNLLYRV